MDEKIKHYQDLYYLMENCLKLEGKQFILATKSMNFLVREIQLLQQTAKDEADIDKAMAS